MANIAIIDDEELYQLFLESEINSDEYQCEIFSDFSTFFDSLDQNPSRYDAVIVDRLVGSEDAVRHRFPVSCIQSGYNGPIFLYTNHSNNGSNQNDLKGFDCVLKKGDLIDWSKLLFEKVRRRN